MWLHGQRRRLSVERAPDGRISAHVAEPALAPVKRLRDGGAE
jgi:hypothetical protein